MKFSLAEFIHLNRGQYADRPDSDPELVARQDTAWYMSQYPVWRSHYTGAALMETISSPEGQSGNQKPLRWPARINLIRSYCNLYGGMLWGRGKTGADANDLFDVVVNPSMPGRKKATAQAKAYQEILNYFWTFWFHILRASGITQHWAGGCVLKVAWDPYSPNSVFGIQIQHIEPEHFWPIPNPLNYSELLAVKVRFEVDRVVAAEKYGLTPGELENFKGQDRLLVEEHWDRYQFYVRVGGGQGQPGVIARVRLPDGTEQPLIGPNPYIHPATGMGIIPFVYVPRIRTQGFYGESLVPDLEGIQQELNKAVADYGDALIRSCHPSAGISDYNGPGAGKNMQVIPVPASGLLNMGRTTPGGTAARIHTFPLPQVPPQTEEFTNMLLSLGEMSSGLTAEATRGGTGSQSGYAIAMAMLPTSNVVDWERSMWQVAIAGKGGIHEIATVIWFNKADVLFPDLMGIKIEPGMLGLSQSVKFRPVIPRDRAEIVDEVVRLATIPGISPWEWLSRLGDIEDIDKEVMQLAAWVAWIGKMEASVAGRAVQVSKPTNTETPIGALPQVSGKTMEPAARQQATEPEGQAPATKSKETAK